MPNHPGLLSFLPCHEHVDLAQVGPENLEGHQHTLGGHSSNAPSLGIVEGLVGAVLEVAVHPLDGTAEGTVGGVPFRTLVEQFLSIFGPDFRRHGNRLSLRNIRSPSPHDCIAARTVSDSPCRMGAAKATDCIRFSSPKTKEGQSVGRIGPGILETTPSLQKIEQCKVRPVFTGSPCADLAPCVSVMSLFETPGGDDSRGKLARTMKLSSTE